MGGVGVGTIIWNWTVVRNLFDKEKEDYYKPVHIEYESNGDRNKTLWIEEYFNKIRPYLKDVKSCSRIWYVENSINNSN